MVLACLAGRAQADSAGPGLVKTLVPYHPFDGHSSYALEKDEDEPIRRSQNLMTAKNRLGMKPYGKLFKDGSFQQERLIFNDVATGAEIHLLTRDYGDDVPYHLGAWSANGAHIVWRRPIFGWSPVQSDGPMAMNSDGSNIRPVFRDKGNVIKNIRCSPVDPKLCYAIVSPMKMIEFNILTGKAERDMGEVPGAWHLKISMDGKYLYANTWDYRAPKGRENSIVWVRSVDGSEEYTVKVGTVHDGYYIHPKSKHVLVFQGKHEGLSTNQSFMVNLETNEKTALGFPMSPNHATATEDHFLDNVGRLCSFDGIKWTRNEKSVYWPDADFKDSAPYYDDPHHRGGYMTWKPGGESWSFQTNTAPEPYIAELQINTTDALPSSRGNRSRICFHNFSRAKTMDAPDASPDGTKVLFNTDVVGGRNFAYVVARKPWPPQALEASWSAGSVKLSWTKPRYHKETKGYNVYRSNESGRGYEKINSAPITSLTFTDRDVQQGKSFFYVVTSVEHSTLEGNYSNEAAACSDSAMLAKAPRRIFVEAEHGEFDRDAVWMAFHRNASNLYYLWQRVKDRKGKFLLPVLVPKNGAYTVWARVKADNDGQLTINGKDISFSGAQWSWQAVGGVALEKGAQKLEIETGTYGTYVDCLYVASDRAFAPAHKNGMDVIAPTVPKNLRVASDGAYIAKLNWMASVASDVHHYNVYVGTDSQFTAEQATLIASPTQPRYIDWQVKATQSNFYRVRAVDFQGNESQATPAAGLKTKPIKQFVETKAFDKNALVFKVPAAGKYQVWTRLRKPDQARWAQTIQMTLSFEGNPRKVNLRSQLYDIKGLAPDEFWHTYGPHGIFDLKRGQNTLKIDLHKRNQCEVEEVLLTNDLSYVPGGYVHMR